VALCVASSGIAAWLLEGGQTAHSQLKVPISALENSVSEIVHGTHLHEVLKQTKVIIWDEVPMQHKHAIDAVDHSLRDVLHKDSPFGGITVVFGGDFQQTLPVVPQGLIQEIIVSSFSKGCL
jgi:hypothetical protein